MKTTEETKDRKDETRNGIMGGRAVGNTEDKKKKSKWTVKDKRRTVKLYSEQGHSLHSTTVPK